MRGKQHQLLPPFFQSSLSTGKKERIPYSTLVSSGQPHFTDGKNQRGLQIHKGGRIPRLPFLNYQPIDNHLDQNTGNSLDTPGIHPLCPSSQPCTIQGVFLGSFSDYDSRAIMGNNGVQLSRYINVSSTTLLLSPTN